LNLEINKNVHKITRSATNDELNFENINENKNKTAKAKTKDQKEEESEEVCLKEEMKANNKRRESVQGFIRVQKLKIMGKLESFERSSPNLKMKKIKE